jgi:hypothetical protein
MNDISNFTEQGIIWQIDTTLVYNAAGLPGNGVFGSGENEMRRVIRSGDFDCCSASLPKILPEFKHKMKAEVHHGIHRNYL